MKLSYKSIALWGLAALVCIVLLSMPAYAEEAAGPGDGLPEYSDNGGGIIYQGDSRNAIGTAIGSAEGDGVISDDPEAQQKAEEAAASEGAEALEPADTTVQEGDYFIHDGVKYKRGDFAGNFRLSGYTAGSGSRTYSGTKPRAGHTTAADLGVLPIGTVIIVEGTSGRNVSDYNGVYRVEDTGSGVNGNHLDLFFNSYAEAAGVTHHGWQYSNVYIAVPVEE
ncbi:MAG: 3D domain-containing protein [Eubacteriales bacterium]|nr:3D domain-containing protein [Eubacteriales bacterium]